MKHEERRHWHKKLLWRNFHPIVEFDSALQLWFYPSMIIENFVLSNFFIFFLITKVKFYCCLVYYQVFAILFLSPLLQMVTLLSLQRCGLPLKYGMVNLSFCALPIMFSCNSILSGLLLCFLGNLLLLNEHLKFITPTLYILLVYIKVKTILRFQLLTLFGNGIAHISGLV